MSSRYSNTDRRALLRVKLKALADEARIIRAEENDVRNRWLHDELHRHRVVALRHEARATHLAYGLIRSRTLAAMESSCASPRPASLWKRVREMCQKYGPPDSSVLLARCVDDDAGPPLKKAA